MASPQASATTGCRGEKSSVAEQASNEELFASDEFRMYAYKILPCPKKTSHEWTTCPYAHPGEKAKRRDPRVYNYLAIPCENTKHGGTCPLGDACSRCHNLFEYWLSASRYRTQLCRDMENGHCKRQVCFFAHSIEELRVPDHSHLSIPPEMQAAAAAGAAARDSGSSSGSGCVSPDSSAAAGSSDNSSGSSGGSTPRAGGSKGGADRNSSTKTAASAASKLSKAVNINSSSSSGGGVPRPARLQRGNGLHNSYGPSMQSPNMQWAGMAGTPAAAAALLSSSYGSPEAYAHPHSLTASSPLHQHQRALLHQQQQAQQGLAHAGSLYEQQLQLLLAAESAQAQHAQLMLLLQGEQAAAGLSAQLSGSSSMGTRLGDACSASGGSPPLSPLSASFLDSSAPSLGDQHHHSNSNTRMFVPPSASSGALMAAAAAGWESASLMRSISMPPTTGLNSSNLVRHGSSSFAGMRPGTAATAASSRCFGSSGGSVAPLHQSAGSSVSMDGGQQELTLASLLAAKAAAGDNSWGAASACTPAVSMGLTNSSAGFPLGSYGAQGMPQESMGSSGGFGGLVSENSGLDAATLLMLQQQQQHMLQSKASMGSNMQLLQAVLNRGDAGADCSGQGAMNDVIGMMMQQLVLQQRPSVL